jgi:lysophospholipase L1-like esterase
MKLKISNPFILFIFLGAGTYNLIAQKNPGFESGLENWQCSGKISVGESAQSYQGGSCLRMDGFSAMIYQKAGVNPLSIVQLSAYIKTSGTGVQGTAFIGFYDSRDSLIIEYRSNPLNSEKYSKTGYYTLAPAESWYLKYGVIKTDAEGILFADNIELSIDPGETKNLITQSFSFDNYLKPFWESDTIFNETVLLLSENNKKASGKLLLNPAKIIDVKSYDLKATYTEGIDYSVNGKIITRIDGSGIPYKSDTSFSQKDLAWYDLQSGWVVVTYVRNDKWKGTTPAFKGFMMPHTTAKLKSTSLLRIVACGMSITRGMDVSGYHNLPPGMPPYVDLFVSQLRKKYNHNNIRLYNAGLPGASADWAAQYADEYINPFKPDLVIIDFGMNDFWRYSPAQFKNSVLKIIEKCRAYNPDVEFLLVSNMKFDPDYIKPSNDLKTFYESNLAGYNTVLQSFCTTGIINLDMTSISDEIYLLKKAKDCLVNPLHPNDYLARWYAQGLAAMFIQPGP